MSLVHHIYAGPPLVSSLVDPMSTNAAEYYFEDWLTWLWAAGDFIIPIDYTWQIFVLCHREIVCPFELQIIVAILYVHVSRLLYQTSTIEFVHCTFLQSPYCLMRTIN